MVDWKTSAQPGRSQTETEKLIAQCHHRQLRTAKNLKPSESKTTLDDGNEYLQITEAAYTSSNIVPRLPHSDPSLLPLPASGESRLITSTPSTALSFPFTEAPVHMCFTQGPSEDELGATMWPRMLAYWWQMNSMCSSSAFHWASKHESSQRQNTIVNARSTPDSSPSVPRNVAAEGPSKGGIWLSGCAVPLDAATPPLHRW